MTSALGKSTAKKPSESKFANGSPLPVRKHFLSFFLDWAIWGYVAYVIVYLLNYYWYTVYISWYGKLTLPNWAWPWAIIGTLEPALLCRAFGHSLGAQLFGLILARPDHSPAPLTARFLYFMGLNFSVFASGGAFYGGIWLGKGLAMWSASSSGVFPWVFACVLGGGALLLFVSVFPWYEKIAGIKLVPLPEREEWRAPPPPWYRTNWGIMKLMFILVTIILGWYVTGASIKSLTRLGVTSYLWKDFATPNFVYLFHLDPWLNESIVGGLVESIFMAFLATTLGAIIAFPLSFLGARNIMNFNPLALMIYTLTRGFFNIVRSVEALMWAMIFALWVTYGTPFAGTIALMIHTIAALGKLYSEQVEHIDPGPLEAIRATGANRLKVIRYAVIPQIIPPYLAFTFYRWDINIRMSTVIGLVGGGGIGRVLFYYKHETMWHKVGAVIIAIALVVWALDYISGRVREKVT